MADDEGEVVPQRPLEWARRPRVLVVGVLLALLISAGGGWALGRASALPGYDADAHLAAIRYTQGHDPADWPRYQQLVRETCADKNDAFAMFVAVAADAGGADIVRLDTEFACPQRMGEFWDVILLK